MAAGKPPIVWSPEAQADLSEIWDYYLGVAGVPTANNVIREIGRVIAMLAQHPHAGRARDEVRPGLRSMSAPPHVVFYRVRDDRTELVRILHGRRDLDEIFASKV